MRQPIQVAIYPFRFYENKWEVLLMRRIPNPEVGLGQFWQGVTGGVEEGETVEQTAARELIEETGFDTAKIIKTDHCYSYPIRVEWSTLYDTGAREINEFTFLAIVQNGDDPDLSDEHDRFEWLTIENAKERLFWPENKKTLDFCRDLLADINT